MKESLKQIRRNKGISQEYGAKKIGVSVKQFQRYERYEVVPPLDKAVLWAELLGYKIAKFVSLYNINKEE